MKTVTGNLIAMALNGDFDVIVHGCNCFCTMGAGIAKQIKETFPRAFEEDCYTPRGGRTKLGSFSSHYEGSLRLTIINGYTQYYAGANVDYDAIRSVFRQIKRAMKNFNSPRIGYPKIGAGIAGGDWEIISKIIDEELEGSDHTLVVLPEATEKRRDRCIHSDVFYLVSKGRIEEAIQIVDDAIANANLALTPDKFALLHYPILRRALDSTEWLNRMLEVGLTSNPVINLHAEGNLIIEMANSKNGLASSQ